MLFSIKYKYLKFILHITIYTIYKHYESITKRKWEYIYDDRSVKAKEILSKEENVVYLSTTITITTLPIIYIYIFIGEIPETNYLFLGDFVDRCYNSVEIFLLLLCLPITCSVVKQQPRITINYISIRLLR